MKQSLCWSADQTQSFIHSLKKCSLPDLHSPIARYTVNMCVCVYTFIDVNVCVYVRRPLADYIFFPGSLVKEQLKVRSLNLQFSLWARLAGNEATGHCMSLCYSSGFPGMSYNLIFLLHEYYGSKLMSSYLHSKHDYIIQVLGIKFWLSFFLDYKLCAVDEL